MPWGIPREEYEQVVAELEVNGVTESYIRGWGAGFGDEIATEDLQGVIRYFQAGASPASIAALERMNMEIDVRDILPSIRVPTLIVNATHDPISPIEGARYLAERIPGARLFEYEDTTHVPTSREQESLILDEIEEFVTGSRPAPVHRPGARDRALHGHRGLHRTRRQRWATSAWRELYERHTIARSASQLDAVPRARGQDDGRRLLRHVRRTWHERYGLRPAIVERGSPAGDRDTRRLAHRRDRARTATTCAGLAVRIGARGSVRGRVPREVLVSSTVKDLTVGSGLAVPRCRRARAEGSPRSLAPVSSCRVNAGGFDLGIGRSMP